MLLSRSRRSAAERPALRVGLVAAALLAMLLAGPAGTVQAATDSDGDGLTNAFELAYGLNPNNPDTNGDGVLDPAEDPDHDGLSNLAEQRDGTNPLKADSNHNGIDDWHEDANHNGVVNGLEQDRRAVPSNLKPSLANASSDQPPSYRNGCHSSPTDPAIHPCAFGDKHGTRTIAIFGDSHMAQWLPGLIKAGKPRGWKIISITKSGCPSATVDFRQPAFPGAEASCTAWRSRAEKWLRNHPPDVIIVSSSHAYLLVDRNGHRIPASGLEHAWDVGLAKTLNALPTSSRRLVLGDTPFLTNDVPKCLSKNLTNMAACEDSRHKALDPAHDAAQTNVAAGHSASFASLDARICSYDPCPVVIGSLLIYRNESHLTATYSRQLAPSLARIVGALLP